MAGVWVGSRARLGIVGVLAAAAAVSVPAAGAGAAAAVAKAVKTPEARRAPATPQARPGQKPPHRPAAKAAPAARPATAKAPPAARKPQPPAPLDIDTSLLPTPTPAPLMLARALREEGAHTPPVAPPAQLEGPPRTNLLRESAALRMRSQVHRRQIAPSPMEAPDDSGEQLPFRVAMLPRMALPLPSPSRPPLREQAPGPWNEAHMEAESTMLGRWAKPALPPAYYKVHYAAHAPQTCLPAKLKKVLYDIAEKVGEVRVISTFRDPARNRRVGGASRSMHLECRAIDFFVPGPHRDLVAYLASRSDVGGYKRYPWGFYHIDNGPRRTW